MLRLLILWNIPFMKPHKHVKFIWRWSIQKAACLQMMAQFFHLLSIHIAKLNPLVLDLPIRAYFLVSVRRLLFNH